MGRVWEAVGLAVAAPLRVGVRGTAGRPAGGGTLIATRGRLYAHKDARVVGSISPNAPGAADLNPEHYARASVRGRSECANPETTRAVMTR